MKRILYFLLALFFPWVIFFMDDKLGKALVAFMLQASVIGWIFATVWAWRTAKESFLDEKQTVTTKT